MVPLRPPLLVSRRPLCDLISRCEDPSRNPSSPLDCRAADRFVSPLLRLPLLLVALPALYVSFTALSARFFTQADVRGTATQVRTTGERERGAARRTDGRTAGTGATCQPFVGNRRTGWWICLFCGFGSGARITSHGTKPAFFHVIHRFVSPGVLTPEETGKRRLLEERSWQTGDMNIHAFPSTRCTG